MPALKITNPKIGPALVKELKDEPVFQNIKAFSATNGFLKNVAFFSRDQEFATIPAKLIKEKFKSYGINYKKCLEVLVRHGIMEIDRHYVVGIKTRGYRVTEKGARLMCEGEMQYLKRLFTSKELRRKLQKRESYKKTRGKKYSNSFLQYIHLGRMGYKYGADALKMIEESDWEHLSKLKALMSLTDFAERNFVDLKHNEADHRVWNEFVGMKSDLRKFFSLGKLKYRFVMDIRSCHPLFLAHYLVNRSGARTKAVNPSLFNKNVPTSPIVSESERERSERYSNTDSTTIGKSNPIATNNNTILHYDGGNSDIQAELAIWNRLFSDPDTDPRNRLIKDLGYTREQAKAALNQSINGGKHYRKFIAWFKNHFPLLHTMWHRSFKDKVGLDISALYETKLMQDMELYGLAESLGLHLTYEFDGCGVMCRDDDKEAPAKIQRLIGHIQARSEALWSIRPVIVVKTAGGEMVDMRSQLPRRRTDETEKLRPTAPGPVGAPANRTAASASRRSSNRSLRPARKRRVPPRPSKT